jgi:hypothetical protein
LERVENASGSQFSAVLVIGADLSIFFTLSGALRAKITDFGVFFFFCRRCGFEKKTKSCSSEFLFFGVLVSNEENLIFRDFGSESSRTG